MEHAGAGVDEQSTSKGSLSVLFLIKIGEIALKGENRTFFESRLRRNIRRRLADIECTVTGKSGRFYLRVHPNDAERARERLMTVFGITSFSRTTRVEKSIEVIRSTAAELVSTQEEQLPGKSFKVEARRTDKQFPMRSYDIAADLGGLLLERFPGLVVDVHHPDWVLNVEIRDQSYLYLDRNEGPGGLPVGTAGRGMLLLSGGIDSPVAGYLMAKRGLNLSAVYFHAYPYTSEEAREKVTTLARILSPYLSGLTLYVVPFTDAQMRIKQRAAAEEVTLLMRACMMKIAERLAIQRHAGCLVTGESLGQVASQTMESMSYTGSVTSLPVFRPLIGMDKEEIIRLARKVGTFETSILPYEDCCTIFSPKHPLIRPNTQRMRSSFEALEIDALLIEAADKAEAVRLSP